MSEIFVAYRTTHGAVRAIVCFLVVMNLEPAFQARLPQLLQLPSAMCLCRCLAQLGALGYLLVPALALNSWWLLLIYALALIAVASAEAVSRSTHGYKVSQGLACSHCLYTKGICSPLLCALSLVVLSDGAA